jgi:AraC-like DNA-binding protein
MLQVLGDAKKGFVFERDIRDEEVGETVYGRHYHDLFEIYYLESGRCTYFIDKRSYELMPGDIAIIPAGIIHNTHYVNSRHSRMLINFSSRFIPSSVLPQLKKITYIYRNRKIHDDILKILNQIKEESSQSGEMQGDIVECYMHMLFFMLIKNENFYDNSHAQNEYIVSAVKFLQKNYQTDVSLKSMAEMFSVCPEHFSREFKKETGFGFCEYLNLLRLKKAEQLLKQNDKIRVSEVSEMIGFNDSNYFSLKFKKMYGTSPKNIRAK